MACRFPIIKIEEQISGTFLRENVCVYTIYIVSCTDCTTLFLSFCPFNEIVSNKVLLPRENSKYHYGALRIEFYAKAAKNKQNEVKMAPSKVAFKCYDKKIYT